jgi:hypothetical protein
MIQSQVNLDHRLAGLRQVGAELRLEKAARESNHGRTIVSAIRSIVGAQPSGRPAGVAAA